MTAEKSVSSRIHAYSCRGRLQWETAVTRTICAQVVSRVVHGTTRVVMIQNRDAADPDHCSAIGECGCRMGARIRCPQNAAVVDGLVTNCLETSALLSSQQFIFVCLILSPSPTRFGMALHL